MTATAFALDPGESHTISVAIADEVRAAMARRRVNQTNLARVFPMSQAALSRRLSGDIPLNVVELQRIATLLGISLRELIPESLSRWNMYSPYLTSVDTRFDDPFQLTLGFEAPVLASVSS